jgi:hypothetical protein
MHRSYSLSGLLVASALAWRGVQACSCAPPPELEIALAQADAVFVGALVSVTQTDISDTPGGKYLTEVATFRIIRSWKNNPHSGETITLRSALGPGACGISANNSPPWLEHFNSETRAARPSRLSGKWLVYAYGKRKQPYELSACTRSKPIEAGGRSEIHKLDRLSTATLHSQHGL